MKAKVVAIAGAVLAALFQFLPFFGVDVSQDEQAKVLAGVTTIVGIVMALFGESPAQPSIEKARLEKLKR